LVSPAVTTAGRKKKKKKKNPQEKKKKKRGKKGETPGAIANAPVPSKSKCATLKKNWWGKEEEKKG